MRAHHRLTRWGVFRDGNRSPVLRHGRGTVEARVMDRLTIVIFETMMPPPFAMPVTELGLFG